MNILFLSQAKESLKLLEQLCSNFGCCNIEDQQYFSYSHSQIEVTDKTRFRRQRTGTGIAILEKVAGSRRRKPRGHSL